MYSKLALGLALVGSAACAEIVRRDTGGGGGGHHDHGHGGGGGGHAAAPSSGYSEPAASSGYAAPSTSYSQPSSGYSTGGGSGYGGGYDVGYEDDGFDLSTIIIPLLIIFGLSLLFPTITTIGGDGDGRGFRRKRDLASAANPMTDVVERVNDIYMAVVESEECMERIACEIGGLAADFGLKENAIAKMADPFVPAKYKSYYQQFKSGQNCHKIKCGSIF